MQDKREANAQKFKKKGEKIIQQVHHADLFSIPFRKIK
jgi:hypothetical protein